MDQKKLRIWTLFTQWLLLNFIPMFPLISMPYNIMQQMEEDIKKNTFSIFYYTNWWQFIWSNWWTLRKMYENMGFCWPIFSRKKIKSWILSSYWKILLSRNPYSRIFYSVEYFAILLLLIFLTETNAENSIDPTWFQRSLETIRHSSSLIH